MSRHHHGAGTSSQPAALPIAVITLSDTRTPADDEGGALVESLCRGAGFTSVERHLLPDDPEAIQGLVRELCDAGRAGIILMTGGTGISGRDRTAEALAPLVDRRLEGFGELFRYLSFAEIGPAAMLSRAMAGVRGTVPIFSMPGSPKAVRLAMERLILPELGHVVSEARRRS